MEIFKSLNKRVILFHYVTQEKCTQKCLYLPIKPWYTYVNNGLVKTPKGIDSGEQHAKG